MKETKAVKKDSFLMIGALIVLCIILAFSSFKQKQFRSRLNEVKDLPYSGKVLEQMEDGNYVGKVATSFIALELNVQIKDHQYKSIDIKKISGGSENYIQGYIEELVQNGKVKVPSKKAAMLEYLVFLKCLDQLEETEAFFK